MLFIEFSCWDLSYSDSELGSGIWIKALLISIIYENIKESYKFTEPDIVFRGTCSVLPKEEYYKSKII